MASQPEHDITSSSVDIEKSAGTNTAVTNSSSISDNEKASAEPGHQNIHRHSHVTPDVHVPAPSALRTLNARIEGLSGFEARGIKRVEPDEREPPRLWDDIAVALLWFSANISVNNLAVGLFGPMIFGLGFVDSALCAVFGALLGSVSTAYMSIWGPQSGNRTMVVLRFFMGYWPAKLPTLLNIILMVGYCTIDAIISGQILSAVNGAGMTIIVGIIVVQIIAWIVAVFGMKFFHHYERFAWIPQLLVLFILIGAAGSSFDSTTQSVGESSVIAANRLSFLSLCLYVPNSWGAAASDFYVYYPEKTKPIKIFMMTLVGLWVSFTLVYMIGIGLATGIANNQAWADANAVSTGGLIVAGFGPLNGFGLFCAVIIALGVIANSIPGTYSAALGCQVMGRYGKAVPRWIWSCVLILIELVLAIAGREHLLVVMQNFLALMGYWMQFMVFIVLMEHLIFVRLRPEPIDWARWEDKAHLPLGIAAIVAFLLGWLGAVLGMYQIWYTGPIAMLSGPADVGVWVGSGFTIISYIPLRYIELKHFKR